MKGHMCVEVIRRCGCEKACYRMSYKETHQVLEFDVNQNITVVKTKVKRVWGWGWWVGVVG